MNPRMPLFNRLRAVFLLVLGGALASAAEPPGMPDAWSDGFVYANGVRLHYYRGVPAPGKPVIVMAHGVTDNGLCWTTVTEKLQESYDIYMLDTRGHGLSDPFTSSDDGDTLIKDVVAAVKALGVEKPILMGHSMGAATVMRVGAEYPDLAKAVVMLDPFLPRSGGEGRRGGPAAPRDAGAPRRPRNEGAPTVEPRESARPEPVRNTGRDRLSFQMMADPEILVAQNNHKFEDIVATGRRQFPKWSDADVKYWALSKKQYHGAYSDQAWQAMSGSMRIGDSLGKIPVPVLILKADAPPEGRRANEAAVEGMERVKLVHIDGGAHNLHHDELQRTVKELTEFLSGL
jgi:pimeloyl-ACP methyl ester carboxylesterase